MKKAILAVALMSAMGAAMADSHDGDYFKGIEANLDAVVAHSAQALIPQSEVGVLNANLHAADTAVNALGIAADQFNPWFPNHPLGMVAVGATRIAISNAIDNSEDPEFRKTANKVNAGVTGGMLGYSASLLVGISTWPVQLAALAVGALYASNAADEAMAAEQGSADASEEITQAVTPQVQEDEPSQEDAVVETYSVETGESAEMGVDSGDITE